MSGTDITRKIHALAGIDGTVPNTLFAVQDVFDSRLKDNVILHRDGDTIQVGYLAHDETPGDFWEEDDGAGEYLAFKRGDDPNAMMAKIQAEGKIAFFVERYSHGLDHYSVASTMPYPDRTWDVGTCGIFTPCEDVQEQYRNILEEKGEEAARAHAVSDSNRVLNDFSDWRNGSVYGVVVENWRIEGEHVRRIDHESFWGIIGSKHAVDALLEEMPDLSESPERETESELSM